MLQHVASLFMEATVVGIVCVIFLGLMIMAGIKQSKELEEDR